MPGERRAARPRDRACRPARRRRPPPVRGGARSVVADEARDARPARALGRPRRALPRVLPRRSARARDVREPLSGTRGAGATMMRRTLRKKSLPEDLVWVAMIESGFEPIARSPAGAVGLWQFMPETAKIYGLDDRPLARPAPERARWRPTRRPTSSPTCTGASGAGSSRIAAYNMGYGGVAVRRAALQHERLLVARAHRGHAALGDDALRAEDPRGGRRRAQPRGVRVRATCSSTPPVETDEVNVPPGTPLALVAQAAGCTPKDVEALNPELRAARTPPRGRGRRRVSR